MKKNRIFPQCVWYEPAAATSGARSASPIGRSLEKGFSLVELLLALGLFLVVGSAAFTLFAKEETAFLRQQGMAGTNIALRNAAAELQMDLLNAGTAYF